MFKVGQKVICVDAEGSHELRQNAIYTIRYIVEPMWLRWRGRHRNVASIWLNEAQFNPEHVGFAPERFRPAVERKTDISVFTDILDDVSRRAREPALSTGERNDG